MRLAASRPFAVLCVLLWADTGAHGDSNGLPPPRHVIVAPGRPAPGASWSPLGPVPFGPSSPRAGVPGSTPARPEPTDAGRPVVPPPPPCVLEAPVACPDRRAALPSPPRAGVAPEGRTPAVSPPEPPSTVGPTRGVAITLRLDGGVSLVDDLVGAIGDAVPLGSGPAFSFDPLDAPPAPSARFTATVRLSDLDALELRATWFGGRETSGRETGTFGHRDGPGSPLETTRRTSATVTVENEAWSAEALWRRVLANDALRLDGLLGLRAVSFSDRLSMSDFDRPIDAAFDPLPRLLAETESIFAGLEAGASLTWPITGALALHVEAKAFVGGAHRTARTTDAALFAPGVHDIELVDVATAWGASLELGASWRVAGPVRLHLAAEVTFLDGVARVDDALDLDRTAGGAARPRVVDASVLLPALYLGVSVDL